VDKSRLTKFAAWYKLTDGYVHNLCEKFGPDFVYPRTIARRSPFFAGQSVL
jgi:hypothetical protein